jgi:hypothetical protein
MTDQDEPLLTPREKLFLEQNPGAELVRPPDSTITTRKQEVALSGIGGWLQFLIIALAALGPLLAIVTTFGELGDTEQLHPELIGNDIWIKAKTIAWLTIAASCGLSIAAGYLLQTRRQRSTIPLAIVLMWLAWPIVSTVGFVMLSNIVGGDASAAGQLGQPFVFCTIWTIYLLRSTRAKNTYNCEIDDGPTVAVYWKTLSRSTRRYAFFSVCWVVASLFYFTFISVPDPFADRRGPNMWAIVLLPPLLIGLGWWLYQRLVVEIESDD